MTKQQIKNLLCFNYILITNYNSTIDYFVDKFNQCIFNINDINIESKITESNQFRIKISNLDKKQEQLLNYILSTDFTFKDSIIKFKTHIGDLNKIHNYQITGIHKVLLNRADFDIKEDKIVQRLIKINLLKTKKFNYI